MVYLNSLMEYQKRIGGEVYITHEVDLYKKLDMPFNESGRYFQEALEFQRKLYKTEEREWENLIQEEFNPPRELLVKNRNNEELNEQETEELTDFYKTLMRKFVFFVLPNGIERLDSIGDLVYSLEN